MLCRQIEEDVQEEETKYSILSKSHVFNEKHCICCFSRFLLLFNRRILCGFCKFHVCKNCVIVDEEEKIRCCSACMKQRLAHLQSVLVLVLPDFMVIIDEQYTGRCMMGRQTD